MKKLASLILALLFSLSFLAPINPVFAASDNCVDTIIIGDENHRVCDNNGESIYALLNLIIGIMTIGVGILGVIGISVTEVAKQTPTRPVLRAYPSAACAAPCSCEVRIWLILSP